MPRTALIVGVTGVTGRGLAARLAPDPDWRVLGLARRPEDAPEGVEAVAADLSDPAAARVALAAHDDVTHLFHCAFDGRGDFAAQVPANLALLDNALDAVEAAGAPLAHVHLVEGTKWYGSHLGPFPTPAREDDPRHMPPNFYFDQQDGLSARVAAGARWSWSACRPHAICGFSLGNPMNLAMAIAAYGAICRELGLPMRFPGKPKAWESLYQVCDAGHLAEAMVWMATDPACANEAFNIVNGEPFRWKRLWPRLAAMLGCEAGEPQTLPLARWMADKGPLWDRIVERHGLRPVPWEQVANWGFAEFVWSTEWDCVSSMMKARQAGFHAAVDDETMFAGLFERFRAERVIP